MNPCLIYPILQKFFNSLKAFDGLNSKDDLIQNIANMDNFFSEFRNITFVAQKNLNTSVLKNIYERNRNVYLLNPKMRWFVDQRNKITKENPFNLEKEFIVYLYTPKEVFVKHFKSTLDEDFNRNDLLKEIVDTLQKKLQNTYFFSIKLIFIENFKEVDIYQEIIYGIKQMDFFIRNLQKDIPCNCDKCKKLNKMISQLQKSIFIKGITFIWDCELKEKELKHAERTELCYGGKGLYNTSNQIRSSLKNSLWEKYITEKKIIDRVPKLFFNFTIFHLICYQKQNHSIMPVFMIIYSDNTYILWPFESTIKTTFFRIGYEISQNIKFKEIIAIFYAGEYILKKNLDDRNPKEVFVCSMIDNKLTEKNILFDSNKVDNAVYCKKRFGKHEKFNQLIFAPIKKEFKKL